ncbi:MAG: hypothetical protein JRD05_13815 [Deltaproteobacteria bacterium]|nr:hypothetical protein [Deltaproteobacteria bacterium]
MLNFDPTILISFLIVVSPPQKDVIHISGLKSDGKIHGPSPLLRKIQLEENKVSFF